MKERIIEKLLWKPSQDFQTQSNMKKFMNWLEEKKKLKFEDYHQLWNWSVMDLEGFWSSIWEFFKIEASQPYKKVISGGRMPNVKWFPGATLNYAEHVFRNEDSNCAAIIYESETRSLGEISWHELKKSTAAIAQHFKSIGINPGDRIVAYAPNIHETLTAFLACVSIGAVWSSCAPEFGVKSVIDRFKQIEPKVLIAVDGYQYGGKEYGRLDMVKQIQTELPTLKETIIIPYQKTEPDLTEFTHTVRWETILKENDTSTLSFEQVPFDHPLWILYSSGTTGKPKGIVQSHGGILLEHLKFLVLQSDLKKGDRFFWYTTTGWMMWNLLIGGLLTGASIVLYDGNPSFPNNDTLWKFAESAKITTFGTSASFIMTCMKNGVKPKELCDLTHLKSIGSTGSPLPEKGFEWVYEQVKEDVWLFSTSGGTDVCSAFLGPCPLLPVFSGELQARALGADLKAFNEEGREVINEMGELVITKPMPSMPIYFWNDEKGTRYQESYFNMYPNVWRHGDFVKINDRGSCIIYGRSDATINRGGIRMGTSEIYSAIERIPEIEDSVIVDIPGDEAQSYMPLFVVLQDGTRLSGNLKDKIKSIIRQNCSPRHVPDEIYAVKDLPKTLNGKKLEVPIKKILMGVPVEKAVNDGSLANPDSLQYFIKFKI